MTDRTNLDTDQAHLARRRGLASARAERETERKAMLDALVHTHDRALSLRRWIDDFAPRAATAQDAHLSRLFDWARRELTALDAMLEPRHLADDLRARNLFPQVDPLQDALGDPPPRHVWGR